MFGKWWFTIKLVFSPTFSQTLISSCLSSQKNNYRYYRWWLNPSTTIFDVSWNHSDSCRLHTKARVGVRSHCKRRSPKGTFCRKQGTRGSSHSWVSSPVRSEKLHPLGWLKGKDAGNHICFITCNWCLLNENSSNQWKRRLFQSSPDQQLHSKYPCLGISGLVPGRTGELEKYGEVSGYESGKVEKELCENPWSWCMQWPAKFNLPQFLIFQGNPWLSFSSASCWRWMTHPSQAWAGIRSCMGLFNSLVDHLPDISMIFPYSNANLIGIPGFFRMFRHPLPT